jgi:hypothetical protein
MTPARPFRFGVFGENARTRGALVWPWPSAKRSSRFRQDAGDRFGEIELSMVMTVVFAEQRRQAAERFVRERRWEGISAEQVLEMPSIFIGSVMPIVARLAGT